MIQPRDNTVYRKYDVVLTFNFSIGTFRFTQHFMLTDLDVFRLEYEFTDLNIPFQINLVPK